MWVCSECNEMINEPPAYGYQKRRWFPKCAAGHSLRKPTSFWRAGLKGAGVGAALVVGGALLSWSWQLIFLDFGLPSAAWVTRLVVGGLLYVLLLIFVGAGILHGFRLRRRPEPARRLSTQTFGYACGVAVFLVLLFLLPKW